MYELVIIGSGPAGLAAAIYAKRAGLNTLVLEQNPVSGGQVLTTYEVDNYPGLPGIGGYELGVKFREHADKMGCEFKEAMVQAVVKGTQNHSGQPMQAASQEQPFYEIQTGEGNFVTKTVLFATGASHSKLGVPGEEELAGMGVSYCATCDGAFFRGRTVAVVGGGDVAAEDAIFLARTCKQVYLIHRRDQLRAASVLQDAVMEQSNIKILWDTVVESIEGEDQVESLGLRHVKTGNQTSLEVAGVFIAVGITPTADVIPDFVSCDKKGYVLAGEDGATSQPGIFVAGDLRSKPLRQIVTAVSDGANAVTSIQQYLLTGVPK